MRKIAIVGNAGAGKSTTAERLASITGLPLFSIDKMEAYSAEHARIMQTDEWIIDGYGDRTTLWERLEAADTVVYIDLPLRIHYLWVTKRMLTGFFKTPAGWPQGAPIWKSSLAGYKVIAVCHRHLTPKYREFIRSARGKVIFDLTSPHQIRAFLRDRANDPIHSLKRT